MKKVFTGLLGPAYAKTFLEQIYQSGKQHVLLLPDENAVQNLLEDLKFFLKFHHNQKKLKVFAYPGKESLFKSKHFLEDQRDMQERIKVLHALVHKKADIILVPVMALSQVTIPIDVLKSNSLHLSVQQEIDREHLIERLVSIGYEQVTQVDAKGQFSVRGSIVDVFLSQARVPYRLEFFADEIESIRSFDVFNQKSLDELKQIDVVPSSEILLNKAISDLARKNIKNYVDAREIPASKRTNILLALDEQQFLPIYHDLLPVFYGQQHSILDYIKQDENAVWLSVDPLVLKRSQKKLEDKLLEKNDQQDHAEVRCFPQEHFIEAQKNFKLWDEKTHFVLQDILSHEDTAQFNHVVIEKNIQDLAKLRHALKIEHKKQEPLKPLLKLIDDQKNQQRVIFIVCEQENDAHKLKNILQHHDLSVALLAEGETKKTVQDIVLCLGSLSESFVDLDSNDVFISSKDIFGSKKKVVQQKVQEAQQFGSLQDLSKGDYIVHIDHGVGVYQGLERIKFNNLENDFLKIEYAGQDKLFLPVYRLNRIHKYVGGEGRKPSLDKLGQNSTWEKTKAKAKKAVEEMAQELIELYAKRQLASGKAYQPADEMYKAFESDFPFEETPDQLKTIDDIAQDLESSKPMDRLVCGDVGFGKTEIALRAAFRTVEEGKQTAVLVPTTILCQQHYETFKERMQGYPVKVDFLSRFQSKAAQKKIVDQLAKGELDIVVGTHRLLSKDIKFKNLGLLVLDEEHRFGVKHKETIKSYRNQVNVLTLTATPIPRTLQLSMTGIRDLSIINTPPLDRKSVKTFLCKNDDALIRDAIRKELARKGQVFFLHNRVDTMDAQWLHLKTLVPEARIEYAHGQMDEKILEQKMLGFIKKEFDVLLSTTIIESGVDVPNANTMIINRADCFGLAQLYQLRGRVGRSDKEAYTYLMIPGEDIISSDALKRLRALQRFTDLGSGLKIAMHDLEIRGAGNMLGSAQSGHAAEIGFELYASLLEREVRKLKGESQTEEEIEPEIQTTLPAYFPEEYVRDTGERLVLYKRFSAAKDEQALESLVAEVRDRFGPIPRTVENLVEVIQLKIVAKNCGVSVLRISDEGPSIEFSDKAPINMDKLLKQVKRNEKIQLHPDQRLSISIDHDMDAFKETKAFLKSVV
ncbi:MAG TPA: transcription-repair coupling factor [Oligoflexia bacterium]|nr:transcription-repair coupling factor [Oligoflexia bacterium]HMR25573.1 transcription-repair coupling factor [Oligoflexia bacterium]